MTRLFSLSMLALALLFAGCASSNETVAEDNTADDNAAAETQHADADFEVYSWDQVSAAMTDGAVLIDARGADAFKEGHIEGAINLSYKDDTAFSSALPAEKDTTLIFYCGPPQ